ncbi:helix-turn-helix transcriptional regulator [Micromonospora sp. NPDC048898]|uniref:helix-turn-helix transcriptional regulator n=1 Tax=Micromonospora sp. NPDC048898 TaxID=3364260 RepID=UPI003720162B
MVRGNRTGVTVLTVSRNRLDLAEFLRSRRERIMPAHVGLPVGPRRRTPGLRREEIAVLAGLSPTWYTYLEQGRDIRPSSEVLDSLARVLQLSEDERRYLYLLANGQAPPASPDLSEAADEGLVRQIVALTGETDYPVYAGNIYAGVTAWNAAAARWYTDFGRLPPGRRNMLWWMLTDPQARERIGNWAADTRDVIARFRIASAARPWDQHFNELIEAMREASPEFRTWWSDHDVRGPHTRLRHLRLPGGQALTVQLVVLRMTDAFNSVVLHVPTGAEGDRLRRVAAESVVLRGQGSAVNGG